MGQRSTTEAVGGDRGVASSFDDGATQFAASKGLWLHAAALLLVLLAFVPIINTGALIMPDEGVYLAQANALADGRWASPRPAADVDPEGLIGSITDGGVSDDQVVHYYKHPLYPLLLVGPFAAGGAVGVVLLSVLGTWLAAVVSAIIACTVRNRYGAWTLWLVGIGSPLFFDAYVVVGHSVVTALAAVAVLGVVLTLRDNRVRHIAYVIPSVVVIVALRGEGLAFAAALGAACLAVAMAHGITVSSRWLRFGMGTGVLLAAGISHYVDGLAARSIHEGRSATALGRLASDSVDPLAGAFASLLRPFHASWINAEILAPLAVLGLWVAAFALRAAPSRRLLPMVALVGSAVAGAGLFFDPPGLINGLLIAFPVLLPGLVWLSRDDYTAPFVQVASITSALCASAIVATNYGLGGAVEWGGRFFHILLPCMAPLAVIGLDRAHSNLNRREGMVAALCVAVVVLSFSGASVRAQLARREQAADFVDATMAAVELAEQRGGTPLVVIAKRSPDGSDRFFWDQDIDLVGSVSLTSINRVLGMVEATERESALIVTDIDPGVFGFALATMLDSRGWTMVDSARSPKGTATTVLLSRD